MTSKNDLDNFFDDKNDDDVEISDNLIKKGQEVDITSTHPLIDNLTIGIGWDEHQFQAEDMDLDVSCFMLDRNNMTRKNEDFVFYNNLRSAEGSIIHKGDSRAGAGEGDDETILIELKTIPFDVLKVTFCVSIYNGIERDQNLDQVKGAYIRVVDTESNRELLRYKLEDEMKGQEKATCMVIADLDREGPLWFFRAKAEAVEGGISKLAEQYGCVIING